MSTISATETGLYLYGITDAQVELSGTIPGIDGGDVQSVVVDGLAAVVTPVSRRTIRAQRSNLSAHHKLLRGLLEQRTVLPCAFGLVAASEEHLCDVLRANHDALVGQLARLRDKLEMSLSVYWNTSNIFEFFVATNHELQEMRNRVFRPGREPSLEERLELGKLFESQLRNCRERHTQQVVDMLSPYCAEVRVTDPGQEQMIMKLVCLIAKDRQDRFEEGIQEAARTFDDRYTFKYSGPWAPFDFVDINLDLS